MQVTAVDGVDVQEEEDGGGEEEEEEDEEDVAARRGLGTAAQGRGEGRAGNARGLQTDSSSSSEVNTRVERSVVVAVAVVSHR